MPQDDTKQLINSIDTEKGLEKKEKREWLKQGTFLTCCCIITTQYLFFTMPIAYLANELLNVRSISSAVTGSIFGAFSVALAVAAILSRKVAEYFTPFVLIFFSVLILTASTPFITFQWNSLQFTIVLIITRIVQGFVVGISEPQIMSIMTSLYPNKLGTVTTGFELAASISSTIGPLIGGLFYQHYGFAIVTYIPAGINFFVSLLGLILLWIINQKDDEESSDSLDETKSIEMETTPSKQMFSSLFILPVVMLGMVTETLVSMVVNTVESFYPNFGLTYFGLRESFTGGILAVAGVAYSIGTIVGGNLGERGFSRLVLIITFLSVTATSCMLLSLPVPSTLWIWSAMCVCLMSVGSGVTQISILPCLITQYQSYTGVNTEVSSCQMSGLFRAAYFSGAFGGPILGGLLLQILTYKASYIVLGTILAVNVFVLTVIKIFNSSLLESKFCKHGSYQNLEYSSSD